MPFPSCVCELCLYLCTLCICLVTAEIEASDVSHHVDAGAVIKPWSFKKAVFDFSLYITLPITTFSKPCCQNLSSHDC